MPLPPKMTVALAADLCAVALQELETLDPTEDALGHWLWTSYRSALVVGSRNYWPTVMQTKASIEALVLSAQRRISHVRRLAYAHGDLTSVLPPRVPVTRVRDADGRIGFAPIDAPDLTLTTRGLALLLADHLGKLEVKTPAPADPPGAAVARIVLSR